MTTVRSALETARALLEGAGVDSPTLTAELLLAHVLQIPRLKVLLDRDASLGAVQEAEFEALVNRRATRIPLQYLTGSAPFLELELLVSPAVLIPRPETEGLALLASQRLAEFSGYGLCRVLDFATGSGCLALYLARHHPEVEIHALDLSLPALDIARENARRLNLTSNIHFHHGDGFGAFCDGNGILPTDLRFDLLVSNPPYIPSHEVDELAPEVRRHEPRLALDGGTDGLNFYRRLIQEAPAWLNPGAWFLAEFGDDQANELQTLFARTPWTRVTIVPDLGGRDRILAVQYQP